MDQTVGVLTSYTDALSAGWARQVIFLCDVGKEVCICDDERKERARTPQQPNWVWALVRFIKWVPVILMLKGGV